MYQHNDSIRLERLAKESEEPAWMKDMHEHFRDKGFFRPEDIRRVLGNQAEGVSMPRDPDAVASLFLSR